MTTRADLLTERLSQYQRNDDQFRVSHETELTLPAGIYSIGSDRMGISFTLAAQESDDISTAEDPRLDDILEEAVSFWGKRPKYTELGLKHKRGILLESAPGTGKSVLMNRIAEDAIAKNAIVFNTTDPRLLTEGLQLIRKVEKDRNILVMLDDIDTVLYAESALISLLDGEASISNVLFIASTNYIERFPKRLIRPGRFDTVVNVESPPETVRKAYFQSKIPPKDKQAVEEMTKVSSGFSFAQMKELVVSTRIYGRDINKEAARIKSSSKLGMTRAESIMGQMATKHETASVIITADTKSAISRVKHKLGDTPYSIKLVKNGAVFEITQADSGQADTLRNMNWGNNGISVS